MKKPSAQTVFIAMFVLYVFFFGVCVGYYSAPQPDTEPKPHCDDIIRYEDGSFVCEMKFSTENN